MAEAIFNRRDDLFVPTIAADGPWAAGSLHGGPPTGLLARCLEQHVNDPAFQLTRLTTDLFRVVPSKPLSVTTRDIRRGRRIIAAEALLLNDGEEVARASSLWLRRTDTPGLEPAVEVPPGPEGYEIRQGIYRRDPRKPPPPGFHTAIESCWVSDEDALLPTTWLRIPVPLVEGEETSPVATVAALSDFGNALAASFRPDGYRSRDAYINADITMYLDRDPRGEWVCLQVQYRQEVEGVGHTEAHWFDRDGRFAHVIQSRLLNSRPERQRPETSAD